MTQDNLDLLPEDIREEFSVEPDGKIYASRRAVARLSGLNTDSAIKNILNNILHQKNLSKPLQTFAGQSFNAAPKLPDVLVGAIIVHYALKGREQAINCMMAFNNIGIRTWFQQQLGWQPEAKPHKPMSPLEMLELQVEIAKDHEKRICTQEQGQRKLFQIAEQLQEQCEFLDELNTQLMRNRIDVIVDSCENFLLSDEEPAEIPERKKIWKIVNSICWEANCLHDVAWRIFYKQLKDRYGFDAIARSKNQNISPMDAVEQGGKLKELHMIVSSAWRKIKADRKEREIFLPDGSKMSKPLK